MGIQDRESGLVKHSGQGAGVGQLAIVEGFNPGFVGMAVEHKIKIAGLAMAPGGFGEMAKTDFQPVQFGLAEGFEKLDLFWVFFGNGLHAFAVVHIAQNRQYLAIVIFCQMFQGGAFGDIAAMDHGRHRILFDVSQEFIKRGQIVVSV